MKILRYTAVTTMMERGNLMTFALMGKGEKNESK